MRLRVGLDVAGAANASSGIGRYTRELCRALLGLEDGPELIGFHNARDTTRTAQVGFPVRNPGWPDRLLRSAWRGLRWPPIERFVGDIDVFHSSDWVQPPQRTAACVTTVHDLGALLHPEWYAPEVVRVHDRKNRDAAERAHRVIAISEYTRATFLERFEVAKDRVQVVANGVSHRFRPALPAEIDATLPPLGVRRPFLLYVGTRERRKNLMGLVDVFARVASEAPDHSLVLVGARPWAEGRPVYGSGAWTGRELEDALAARDLDDRVSVLGQVRNDVLAVLYSAADVFVFPSLFEGFGLPVLEAMACGCAVVASNRSALPEVVGDAGLLADPDDHDGFADTVLGVLKDPRLRSRLVAAGRERAGAFSWTRTAQETCAVYRAAVAERGTPATVR